MLKKPPFEKINTFPGKRHSDEGSSEVMLKTDYEGKLGGKSVIYELAFGIILNFEMDLQETVT